MDTITHTLMGLTIYGAMNKKELPKKVKTVAFITAIAGSNIPDSDIVFQLSEKGRLMYQMWHRGLSHSLLMVPIWALLLYGLCFIIWKVKDLRILLVALLSISLHIGFDALNTWGTGLFEPFSSTRISIGYLSIVDFVIWVIMLCGYLFTLVKNYPTYKVWRIVWLIIILHVGIQALQSHMIYQNLKDDYEKTIVSADFIPGHFTVIGKNGNRVEIFNKTLWSKKRNSQILYSQEDADLTPLYEQNPKAKVLKEWSPFVVVVDNENRLGIFDPRFYRDGNSLLYEYIKKDTLED